MQLNVKASFAAAACATLLGVSAARADGITTSLSGFGTVGGAFTSDKNFTYRPISTDFSGASSTLDIGLVSRLGVQAVFDFGSGFSVTAQELADQRGDSTFSLGTEWFYLQYQPIQDFKFRLGRVVVGTFLLSDSINVGYASTWFQAPPELYGLQPFQNLDGGQILWHHGFGPVTVGLQTSYGTAKATFSVNGAPIVANLQYISNSSVTVEYGDFLVRVSKTRDASPQTLPLSPTFSVNFNALSEFTSVGAEYDNGKAIVMGEWAKATGNNVSNTISFLETPETGSSSFYVAGGWRFNKLTPMVMYGKYHSDHTLLSAEGDYHAWTGILRYDVVRNVALKAQISRPQESDQVYGTATDPSTKRVNVFSLGADFVF